MLLQKGMRVAASARALRCSNFGSRKEELCELKVIGTGCGRQPTAAPDEPA